MSEKVITIATSRDTYNIADAVEHSITVEELIDELRHLPGDCKIVLKNDGGYTYGAISTWDIDSEWLEDGDAGEDDFVNDRTDMECQLSEAVRMNGGKPVKLIAVTSDDGGRLYLSVGYNDSGVLGVATDDEDFVPIEDLSDDEVESVWVSMTR